MSGRCFHGRIPKNGMIIRLIWAQPRDISGIYLTLNDTQMDHCRDSENTSYVRDRDWFSDIMQTCGKRWDLLKSIDVLFVNPHRDIGFIWIHVFPSDQPLLRPYYASPGGTPVLNDSTWCLCSWEFHCL